MELNGVLNKPHEISIITVTLNRESLKEVYVSVNEQTYHNWHHYVIGDGILPYDDGHLQRTCIGFSRAIGADEPGLNMPDGTPNPLLRWALQHLDLGRFVCFLDDDNIYLPSFLEEMRKALVDNPNTGIVLCPAYDMRYNLHQQDGYPEKSRCDNSAFMVHSEIAELIEFPHAAIDKEVIQDFEFIKICADGWGWTRISNPLVIFGKNPNIPPLRGGVKVVYSWALPIKGVQLLEGGEFETAIQLLCEAIAIDEKDAWARWHLGEAYLRKNERANAIGQWDIWASIIDHEINTPHDWIDYCRGLVHLLHGNHLEAMNCFQKAIDRVNNRLQSSSLIIDDAYNIALYLLANNQCEASLKAYQLILSEAVSNQSAINDLVLLQLIAPELPNIDKAMNLLSRSKNLCQK